MEGIFSAENLIALLTLTSLEIVLGIDNIIFISILSGKLPKEKQNKARLWGLTLAMITRVLLLLSLSFIMKLTAPLFAIAGMEISGRDLILIIGGLFLIGKSTFEIHDKLESADDIEGSSKVFPVFWKVLVQIILLDIVFSLDSVITAVGMVNNVSIMITAVVIAVFFMMLFSGKISEFVERHPTIKMLALSFLILIGVSLIADGLDQHIPKGYIYFSMAFSVFVEFLNMKLRKKSNKPIELKHSALNE